MTTAAVQNRPPAAAAAEPGAGKPRPAPGSPALRPRGSDEISKRPGSQLASALDALRHFPVSDTAQERLQSAIAKTVPVMSEMVGVIESDPGLVMSVLRTANSRRDSTASTVRKAVETLTPAGLEILVLALPSSPDCQPSRDWGTGPAAFRTHALDTQRAVDQIAVSIDNGSRDELAATALLHDIGKLVLARIRPDLYREMSRAVADPQELAALERQTFGVDHTTMGGALLRRWNIPSAINSAVEHHHDAGLGGALPARIIQLGDLISHRARGGAVPRGALVLGAEHVGIQEGDLDQILYDFPLLAANGRPVLEDCPLSKREYAVMCGLAKAQSADEIAQGLGVKATTVRSHLHNVYEKLGVPDRAQAVILATKRGWL